jgi:D-alanine-D-alanine ligase
MQGLLDIAGIPYTGSGVAASASGMDKSLTKLVVTNTGVKQADHFLVRDWMAKEDPEGLLDDVEEHFGRYPLFVKPASEGSSVGCSKVKNREQLETGIDLALKFDNKVLVEEAIVGREIEVAVLGNDDPQASCIGEILSANEFYDYVAKYDNIGSVTSIVTDLPDSLQNQIRQTAVSIYEIMGCRGLARVDFFLKEGPSGGYNDGELVFNEINTMPGFTKISMYPQLWEESGIGYGELIDKLIELAEE